MFDLKFKKHHQIFLISISTVIITRVFLYLNWNSSFMVSQKQDQWHHMYTGLIIIIISLFFPRRLAQVTTGIGIGLFLDEFIHVFHLLKIIKPVDYWSIESIIATLIGTLIFWFIIFKNSSNKIGAPLVDN